MDNKKVVGIRCKESGYVRGLVVVEDVATYVNDFRAEIAKHPDCAYMMWSDRYEIVVFDVGLENAVIAIKE